MRRALAPRRRLLMIRWRVAIPFLLLLYPIVITKVDNDYALVN